MRRQKEIMILPSSVHMYSAGNNLPANVWLRAQRVRTDSKIPPIPNGEYPGRFSWDDFHAFNGIFRACSQSSSAFYREGLRQPLRCLNCLSRFRANFFVTSPGSLTISFFLNLFRISYSVVATGLSKLMKANRQWRMGVEQSVGCVRLRTNFAN